MNNADRSPGDRVDLLLTNGRILDVFSNTFWTGDVAIADGRIVGFGARKTDAVRDLAGAWIVPGLIDAHVHIESSQLSPGGFAQTVLPLGTTTLIADPHEIANVLGLDGIRYMLDATANLPMRTFFMAPSCVPASAFETSGATLGPEEVAEILSWDRVIGLGEVMNFPGVIARQPDLMSKLRAAGGRPIDGHAPGLAGEALWAYVSAGPRTDHECTTLEEARAKLRAGMHILIREGTTARNLDALLPLLTEATMSFVHFCTDDRHAETLMTEGHMDDLVRKAIAGGAPPERVIGAATIHAARAYGLPDVGAIAPGYHADLVILSQLDGFACDAVYVAGRCVAERGTCCSDIPAFDSGRARGTIHVDPEFISFRILCEADKSVVLRAIDSIPDQVLTEEIGFSPRVMDGAAVADPDRDILKIAVVERHQGTGNVGLAFVHGFGLRRGALASSVAHDSHNLVVVGVSDDDMRLAIEALAELGGGQVVVADGEVLALLPLPIAGLMSDAGLVDVVASTRALDEGARRIGCTLPAPFMTLSFLALPVIPRLKLTDRGLVDVDRFEFVPLQMD